MSAAHLISKRGTCSRRQVGSVIADPRGSIVVWSYNGTLAGMPHCAGHTDYQPCTSSEHAERSGIYWAARRGVPLEGCSMFITDGPCVACARGIVQAGIVRVVYDRSYRDDQGLILLLAAGLKVDQLTIGDTK